MIRPAAPPAPPRAPRALRLPLSTDSRAPVTSWGDPHSTPSTGHQGILRRLGLHHLAPLRVAVWWAPGVSTAGAIVRGRVIASTGKPAHRPPQPVVPAQERQQLGRVSHSARPAPGMVLLNLPVPRGGTPSSRGEGLVDCRAQEARPCALVGPAPACSRDHAARRSRAHTSASAPSPAPNQRITAPGSLWPPRQAPSAGDRC